MGQRVQQISFARGEITPVLDARTDIEQYAIGLKTLKNGFVHQEGCVSNRAGLEYVGEVKYSNKETRLIPFQFNADQTYILEFGHLYMRVIQDGGYVLTASDEIYELVTPYTEDDIQDLNFSQSGDVLTIVHKSYAARELARLAHNNWSLTEIIYQTSIAAPTGVSATWTGSTSSNTRTYYYLVTAIDDDTQEESERSSVASAVGHREAAWLASEYMTISWNAVAGAGEYNVYRNVNGIYAYIGSATDTSFVDDYIEPDLTATAPIHKNPFEGTGNQPSCVASFQQRKLYANSINSPQTIWASQTASNKNFDISRPLVASDAVSLPMSDIQGNEIRHLIPMKDLIVLCQNSEWRINGSDGVFEATPPPICLIQSNYGASNVQPIVSGTMVIFCQSGGSVVRDLGYDYLNDSYDGDELSLFASHLFYGKQVKYMAYAKEPFRLIWLIMSDGTLLGLTYNKKQKLCGWHQHETDGKFISVATVREEQEDIPYFIVERKINNVTKKYVERMKTRLCNNASTGFFVDCGLEGSFSTAVTTISGLSHLEGKEVIVNADGGIITGLKVTNGAITLPTSAKHVIVGLPYTFELETLNIEGENTKGLKKLINHIQAKIYQSREDFFIVSNSGVETQNARCIDSNNDATKVFSKIVDATLLNNPTEDATIKIRQKYPLPLTILALMADVNLGT